MIKYIINHNYVYGIKVLSKMGGCGKQKKFISKGGIFMILWNEKISSQQLNQTLFQDP